MRKNMKKLWNLSIILVKLMKNVKFALLILSLIMLEITAFEYFIKSSFASGSFFGQF